MNKPLSRIQLNTISDVRSETVQSQHMVMRAMRKVPELTFYFWIIKLLTTAFGESASDTMVNHLDPVIAVALGGIGLVVALILQLTVRRYVAWIYWFAVVMVAVFGTMAADVIHVVLGVPYLISTIGFSIALAVIFVVWYITEKTLSVHSIYTRRRELFYWATVMTTFALGTAAGDMTASTLNLGFLASGILFGVLFALPALGYWLLGLNEILAFWFAYIMTRPFGASFADWLGRPADAGGIGLGRAQVTLALAVLIIGFVGYLTVTRKDIKVEER
ncbi:MAG TPA: hypothetical protein VFB12_07420 [Ktedonobacteraceae bacterium]|nr:hypothetical protein [Ktedonobacteraceae bacterium]